MAAVDSTSAVLCEHSQLVAFAAQLPASARLRWLQSLRAVDRQLAASPDASALIIADPCPVRHVAALLATLAAGTSAICAHPEWRGETLQALDAFAPPLARRSAITPCSLPPQESAPAVPYLYLATGGTGGRLKLARHTGSTLHAATSGLQQFLDQQTLPAYTVLPPYHTGGLMPWIRAVLTAAPLIPCSLEQLLQSTTDLPQASVSIVPTQLYRILQSTQAAALTRLKAILVGGAPTATPLLAQARKLRLPLVPCYGTTETAALVAAIPAQSFLANSTLAADILPHARIALSADNEILIHATSLFHGYHTQPPAPQSIWHSGDRGQIDSQGRLTVSGRITPLIVTGGKKVDPAIVAAAIRTHIPATTEVIVTGLPDPEWGQVVAVLLCGCELKLDALRAILRPHLPSEALPRLLRCLPQLPADEKGKLTATALRQLFHAS